MWVLRRSSPQHLRLLHIEEREYLLLELSWGKKRRVFKGNEGVQRVHKPVLMILSEPKISGVGVDEKSRDWVNLNGCTRKLVALAGDLVVVG